MNVPAYSASQVVDKNGNWTFAWLQVITQLLQQLQTNFSNEGLVLPQQTSSNISTIAPNYPNGIMFYNSSTNTMQVKINGTVKTVTVS